jgi:hypothetical protein
MKIAVSILCFMLWPLSSAISQTSASQDHVRWVESSLREMNAIKVGMTRGDVEKVFVAEAGISTASQKTYTFRSCPYFHIDVEFAFEPANAADSGPNDKVVKMSRPYLAWPTGD